MCEMLYADDILLSGERRKKVEEIFVQWKEAMEIRRLSMHMRKTNLMVSRANATEPVQLCRYHCDVCG